MIIHSEFEKVKRNSTISRYSNRNIVRADRWDKRNPRESCGWIQCASDEIDTIELNK